MIGSRAFLISAGVALADSPIKTGRDLAERLKKDPASLSVSIGTAFGNATHISYAKGMSRAQIQFWDDALGRMAKTDEWKKQLAQFDMEDVYRGSADTARYWKSEHEEVKAVLTELGLVK